MKKQAFLYLGIWLSLFNITSFSMQSEDETLIKKHKAISKQLKADFLRMREEEKEKDKPLTPEQRESLSSPGVLKLYPNQIKEYAPIVDEKNGKRKNTLICSTVIGSFPKDQSHIAQENVAFLRSIQQYSLEDHYEEASFVLFKGPYGTGKTTIADELSQLLRKKTKKFSLKGMSKNKEIFQRIMKEYIQTIITDDGESCVIFLDEIDRLLCPYNFNYSDRDMLVQDLTDCLSEAQRINRDKNQQKYFVLATTNHPERIEEILPYFKSIEIGNPNFDKLVEILGNLISKESFSFDTSALDQNAIENIAKRFEGISIRRLLRLIKHSTLNAKVEYRESTGQDSHLAKPPLCERHFIADGKVFKSSREAFATYFAQCQKMGLKYLEKTSPTESCPEDSAHLSFEQQRVEILNNLIQKMKNADDIFDANEWDQDLIEEVAKTLEGYSADNLRDLFEQAVRIAQEEYNKQQDPRPSKPTLLERHFINAKKLIDEKKISDQKTEESPSQQDWLLKKTGDIFNAIPDFFSKIYSLQISIFSRGKNFIEKISSCTSYKVSSIIMIIFHFLSRKPF